MEYQIPIPIEHIPGPCLTNAEGFKIVSLKPFVQPIETVPANVRRCQECGKFRTELRRCASMGQFFWLCRPCYEKALAENRLIPLQRKLSKAEKKRLKKEKHREEKK